MPNSIDKQEKSQKYAAYFTRELFLSAAYRDLKPASKEILFLLTLEIRFDTSRKKRVYGKTAKRSRMPILNRDEILLTYQQIRDLLGYSDNTISKSFLQLMEHGFIEIIKVGGSQKGDFNVYGIREDWRDWEPGQVVKDRPKRVEKIGFQKKISLTTVKSHRLTTVKSHTQNRGRGDLTTAKSHRCQKTILCGS